jgi:NTP pyrophosphatase (non-canonical NTP hydrolase)
VSKVTLAELALVHSEVSEAHEEIRNIDKETMAKELAGLWIRIMCLAENQEIYLEKYIVMEAERNKTRPLLHNRKML